MAQVVNDGPDGSGGAHRGAHRGGRAGGCLVLDPEGDVRANVTLVLGYDDALAMATGALDPADALAARPGAGPRGVGRARRRPGRALRRPRELGTRRLDDLTE